MSALENMLVWLLCLDWPPYNAYLLKPNPMLQEVKQEHSFSWKTSGKKSVLFMINTAATQTQLYHISN